MKTRKAIVTPKGGEPVEVDIQDPHPAPESIAVVAWRKKMDAWTDDRPVTVEFPEESPAPMHSAAADAAGAPGTEVKHKAKKS